jgi:hypothetical protein
MLKMDPGASANLYTSIPNVCVGKYEATAIADVFSSFPRHLFNVTTIKTRKSNKLSDSLYILYIWKFGFVWDFGFSFALFSSALSSACPASFYSEAGYSAAKTALLFWDNQFCAGG